MALYECEECGDEFGHFPQIILAENSKERPFPNHHNNLFERTFDGIFSQCGDLGETWDRFYRLVFQRKYRRTSRWFCSYECAIKWLEKRKEK